MIRHSLGLPPLEERALVDTLLETYSPKPYFDLELLRCVNELCPDQPGIVRFFTALAALSLLAEGARDVRDGLRADLKKPEILIQKFFPNIPVNPVIAN